MSFPLALGIPSYLSISYAPKPRRTLRTSLIPKASASTPEDSTPEKAASKPTGTSENVAPFVLFGRMMQENQAGMLDDDYIQQGLIRSAAARAANLDIDEFEANLTNLLVIMPFLQARLTLMKPELLADLAKDVTKTATRMIELRTMIPGGNVESVCSQRPSLLLDAEWKKVPIALEKLAEHYDEQAIAKMVTAEPLLLVEDVNKILKELER